MTNITPNPNDPTDKSVAGISTSESDRVKRVRSLFGILPATMTLEEVREDRLNEISGSSPSKDPASHETKTNE
ncbi:hypothetical protein SAMN02745687_00971 [Lachnospiraceae bacterium NK3A20]|nr:hypothetical protein SAMN02745687_00971 [Lachnospiraceae bacterium NK3A20]